MPGSSNQKMKILYLMKILMERTDEAHALTIQELLGALAEYDIQGERKSIYSDLELLRCYGVDIERRQTKTFGYYVASRDFELPELKLLVDAVQSSRFITPKKSAELIKKLSALTSKPQAKELRRQVCIADRPKPFNEGIYYSIDAIHSAIHDGYKINFKYFNYNAEKRRVYRKDGGIYTQTPMALCWSDDKYYLICYTSKYKGFTHYRVDRMSHVEISEEKAEKPDQRQFNLAEHTNRTFGMYSGELVRTTLRFHSSLINAILDRFGADIALRQKEDDIEIDVEVSSSPVFLSWLFQFGSKAEIVAPQSLREAMIALSEETAAKYRA